MRRVLAAVFLLVILGTGAALAARSTRPSPLLAGGAMPALSYRDAMGRQQALAATPAGTVVMLFHSRCTHCHAQLDRLDRELPRLGATRLVLLTTEDSVSGAEITRRWPRLASAPTVTWGSVEAATFQERFGTLVTPALFVFGPDGHLRAKFRGETKLELLVPS
jgi:hypothetical protein